MFEFIRHHQRLMQLLLLILIFPPFALWGVQSYMRDRDSGDGLARIDGKVITESDFDAEQRKELDRMQRIMGSSVDPKMLQTPEARAQTLQTLIADRVLASEIQRAHLTVSENQVRDEVAAMPEIRRLYGADGKLDVEAYDRLLAASGYTREQLMSEVRSGILMREIATTIPSSSIVPEAVVRDLGTALDQTRSVQELDFKAADYTSQVQVSEDDIKHYYETHLAEFHVPEQLKVQYLVLDQAALAANLSVSDDDLKSYYEENKTKFVVPEERRASHILIKVASDASAADREKAKAKAQDVLAKARANPGDFAKLAKQYSEDEGSAEKGGDLDWAAASAYVGPFSDALFKLKPNEMSDLVQTEFGYHIILLTGVRPGAVRTLDQVRAQIEGDVRKRLAATRYANQAEDFRNMVYNQPDSLEPAAQKFGLKIQSQEGVTDAANPALGAKNPLNNDKLRAALFSDDVLKKKHNTEAVDVAPGTVAAARVEADTPALTKTLAEVSDAIRKSLTTERARALAQKAGEAKLAELKKEPSDAGFGPAVAVNRSKPGHISPAAVKEIFKTDVSKLPAFCGADLPGDSFGVFRIAKVDNPGAPDPAREANLKSQLARASGELEFSSYLEGLKKRLKVQINDKAALMPKPQDADNS
ncbi:MAG: SurA N-terminal domain-containing protein [Burkholderiaceae bacterium]|jgi:peptidyl-prolyl cis-trans isomerase D